MLVFEGCKPISVQFCTPDVLTRCTGLRAQGSELRAKGKELIVKTISSI